MVISFNQPAFIPWGGFFARLLSSDRMVLLDGTLLARGFTFVNRNRLKGPEGEVWVTVSLKRKGRGRQKIRDLEIYEKERWRKKFLATLRHYYGHSVHFEPVFEKVSRTVDRPDSSFLDLTLELLDILNTGLGIDRETVLQSETGISGKGPALLVSVAKRLSADEVLLPHGSEKAVAPSLFEKEGIKVRSLRYLPPQYPQFWGEFLPNLSALDLLLCCGKDGRFVIEKGIRLERSG
jgi:WbqC-like protein family